MNIDLETAGDYIMGCLEDCDYDPCDWDVVSAAYGLVDWMDWAGVSSYDDVPSDVFTRLLDDYAE